MGLFLTSCKTQVEKKCFFELVEKSNAANRLCLDEAGKISFFVGDNAGRLEVRFEKVVQGDYLQFIEDVSLQEDPFFLVIIGGVVVEELRAIPVRGKRLFYFFVNPEEFELVNSLDGRVRNFITKDFEFEGNGEWFFRK